LSHPALSSSPVAERTSDVISDFTSDSDVGISAASRTRLEGRQTFSDMANELVEIGLFDLKEAEE
jgi:hypothetical protein